MQKQQRTIKRPVEIEGIGLFSGKYSKIRLLPAETNTGIVFVRADLPGSPRIPVSADVLVYKFRRTGIVKGEVEIDCIEHILSAIRGLEIDNIIIEVEGEEIAHLDGSSQNFVNLILEAGIEEQDSPKNIVQIQDIISVSEGDAFIIVVPHNSFKVSYTLVYNHSMIGMQYFSSDITTDIYIREIAPARTYCFEEEVGPLLEKGIGKGGSYKNVVVIGKDRIIENTLRFPDEPLRHKVLDLIGDSALLGGALQAHIIAIKSGHSLNLQAMKKIARMVEEKKVDEEPDALLGIQDILRTLPHRFPFLMIDKIIKIEGYSKIVGIKNVTINEPFFAGHYPDNPVMPGVMILEAMAQLAGVLLLRRPDIKEYTPVLLGLDDVKLRKFVGPGDQLVIEVNATKIKARSAEVNATAYVRKRNVAEARLKFVLVEKRNEPR